MRLAIVGGALLAATCASSQQVTRDRPVKRACSVSDCFSQRNIRDFEVIDRTTLIVYVGSRRCPFKVELQGASCDMTFAPTLSFHKDEILPRDPATDAFGTPSLSRTGTDRICSNDIQVGVDGGFFTEGPADTHIDNSTLARISRGGTLDSEGRRLDRFGNRESRCKIDSVESLTDDSLIELYVKRGVLPPPPPIGQGQIEVGQQKDEPKAGASDAAPAAEPAGSPDPSTSVEDAGKNSGLAASSEQH